MKKTLFFLPLITFFLLFMKQEVKAVDIKIERDTTVIDTSQVEIIRTMIDLDDPDTAADLKKMKYLSLAAILLTISIFGFLGGQVVAIITLVKFKKYLEVFKEMSTTDPNYLRMQRIIKVTMFSIIFATLPTLLITFLLVLSTALMLTNALILALGTITILLYLVLEWVTFGTNKGFD